MRGVIGESGLVEGFDSAAYGRARAMYAAYGSSPGLRKSPVESATSPREMNERGGAATGMSPSANGRAFGTSPATPRTRAGSSRASSWVSGTSPALSSASPASRTVLNHPLTRTTSSEPAKVKIGFEVGGKEEARRSAEKPPIGMLRAELAGDFTCDVFDSDAYQRLMAAVPEVFAEPTVREAFSFTAKSHAGPGLGPHFDHCIETAITLAKLGMDAKTVAVGLLNDTLDVTSSRAVDLREKFSEEIVDLVQDVSRVHRVSKLHRASGRSLDYDERAQFRAMLLAMTDARVVIVKLAARLIKMRNLSTAPQSQQRAFADETLSIYAPLAARLGIFSVKNELEDLAFKWMNPQAYAELSQTLDQRESIVAALTKLDEVLLSRQAQVVDLCGRQKSVYSIYKKMVAKDKKVEEIVDLRAIRIIVADGETDEESERLCRETLDVAYTLFQPVEGRSKDYISNPKQNGYQSLHSVVRDKDDNAFEIQVRTASMHRTAEYGLAAHWRYKEHEKSATSTKVDQQIQWARFMLTWQNELYDQQKIRPERVANAVDCGADLAPCMFPIHGADCAYSQSQYCLACDIDEDDPTYIISVVDGAVAVCEMKEHSTAADLKFDDQRVPGGARSTEFYRPASIRVNKKTVDISDLASINLQMGDVVEVTRTRILSPNRSWDETDENVELFGDLNLEVHKLPKKSDAVVSESLGLI